MGVPTWTLSDKSRSGCFSESFVLSLSGSQAFGIDFVHLTIKYSHKLERPAAGAARTSILDIGYTVRPDLNRSPYAYFLNRFELCFVRHRAHHRVVVVLCIRDRRWPAQPHAVGC